jgi:predicted unusual protein kinase regulating ubiquinone biosynthesis (AarF/ABC1/UbiB family)
MTTGILPAAATPLHRSWARSRFARVGHLRYGQIASVLVKYGFVDGVDALHLRPCLTAGRRALCGLGRNGHPEPSRAARLRLAFEDLGPTFIKFGQASIAQVHRATLPSGALVAIKVRRPGTERVIDGDLAGLAERHLPDASLYSRCELVAEFARTIRREQDLVRESGIVGRITREMRDSLAETMWPSRLATPLGSLRS